MIKVKIRNILFFAFLLLPTLGVAQESINLDQPATGDAEAIKSPLDRAFGELPVILRPMMWQEWIQESLKDTPPILRDTKVNFKPRTFYMDRESVPGVADRSAWALGGALTYNSGKIGDILSAGSELFTTQRLYGPEEEDGTKLLEDGQEGFSVVGTLYGQIDYAGHRFQGGRVRYDLPFLNSQDNRMIPNTFEGYSIGRPKEISKRLQYGIGYVNQIKERDEPDFAYISEIWGAEGTKRGAAFAGARYYLLEDNLPVGAVNFYVPDIVNVFYSEADYTTKIDETIGIKASFQVTDQRTVGSHDGASEDYSVGTLGTQGAASYNNFAFKLGLTKNDGGAVTNSPWGSYPGYNSSIVEDFNRAGEWAWRAGFAYDFKGLGVDGLTMYSNYIEGHEAIDPVTKVSVPQKYEIDANLDYRFTEGPLANLWIRLRMADVHEEGKNAFQEYRVIVNYEMPII